MVEDATKLLAVDQDCGAPSALGEGPSRRIWNVTSRIAEHTTMNGAALLRVGVGGAVGGATNGWLCYAKLPVSAGHNFSWHVIPAGAAHGAILAVVAFGLGVRLSGRTLRFRLL